MSEQRETEEGLMDEREQVGETADELRGELLLTLEELERWRAQALDVQHRLGHLQEEKRELLRKVSGAALGLLVLEGDHSRWLAHRRERLLSHLLREGDGHAHAGLFMSLLARVRGECRWQDEEVRRSLPLTDNQPCGCRHPPRASSPAVTTHRPRVPPGDSPGEEGESLSTHHLDAQAPHEP